VKTNFDQSSLSALSPLDGRYLPETIELREYFSEAALIKYRILVEVLYLIELVNFLKVSKISQEQKNRLLNWVKNLNAKDFKKVKKIELEIHHDVKAVEYFIKLNLKKLGLVHLSSWVHWGLTSNDINNLSLSLMVQGAKDKILIPQQLQLIKLLIKTAEQYKKIVMPGRTHGQIAIPTTLGKEIINFASKASFFLEKIKKLKLGGKLNGAIGNFNAQVRIYPQKNWLSFSRKFVRQLGLEPVIVTTQINPHLRLIYLLDLQRQLNNVWLDLARDCWLYISYNYLVQKVVGKEVGSSTMPHKVNPINFENAEGNFEVANSLLMMLANKLPISRLQRDLSDSTVKRNLGLCFGYSLLAIKSLIKGMEKIGPNKKLLVQEIDQHPEMLTEALQLVLKTWGKDKAYEKIKDKTRGKKVDWLELIDNLVINKKQKNILKRWQVRDYTGLAEKLTKLEIKKIKARN